MSKRFEDTDKYKKRFLRRLTASYKLLWDYICCECDFAGIWYVDWESVSFQLGKDCKVEEQEALRLFNEDEIRIYPFDSNKKWLIIPFIEFQYGKLNEKNPAHRGVMVKLQSTNIEDIIEIIQGAIKPLYSPLVGAKDMDKDKDKEIKMEKSIQKQVVDMYHELCPSLPKVSKLNKQRNESIPIRVKEIGGIDNVQELLIRVEKSDFLSGRKIDFRCNFDWIFCCKSNWIKIAEGQYDNVQVNNKGLQLGQIINDEQSNDILKKAGF